MVGLAVDLLDFIKKEEFENIEKYIEILMIFIPLFSIINNKLSSNIYQKISLSLIGSYILSKNGLFYYLNKWIMFPTEYNKINIGKHIDIFPYNPYPTFTIIVIILLFISILNINNKIINKKLTLFQLCIIVILNVSSYISEEITINYKYKITESNMINYFQKNEDIKELCHIQGVYCYNENNKYINGNIKAYDTKKEIDEYIKNGDLNGGLINLDNHKIIVYSRNNIHIFVTDFNVSEYKCVEIYNLILMNIFIYLGLLLIFKEVKDED